MMNSSTCWWILSFFSSVATRVGLNLDTQRERSCENAEAVTPEMTMDEGACLYSDIFWKDDGIVCNNTI